MGALVQSTYECPLTTWSLLVEYLGITERTFQWQPAGGHPKGFGESPETGLLIELADQKDPSHEALRRISMNWIVDSGGTDRLVAMRQALRVERFLSEHGAACISGQVFPIAQRHGLVDSDLS